MVELREKRAVVEQAWLAEYEAAAHRPALEDLVVRFRWGPGDLTGPTVVVKIKASAGGGGGGVQPSP